MAAPATLGHAIIAGPALLSQSELADYDALISYSYVQDKP
jgi:hypothetical protein